MTEEIVIGIDLGTTNCVVAALRGKRVELVPNELGNHLHPAVVYFQEDGQAVAGQRANLFRYVDPQNAIFSMNRLVGRTANTPELSSTIESLPFLVEAGGDQPLVEVRGIHYTVPMVVSLLIKHLVLSAERHFSAPVKKAVVTVPANFSDKQRRGILKAGELAGVEILRLLNAPSAAALAYGFGKSLESNIAIFDMGGGSFDTTVLHIRDKVFEVLATNGDSFLGGDDFDAALMDILTEQLSTQTDTKLGKGSLGRARLAGVCGAIKRQLSRRGNASGTIDDFHGTESGKSLRFDVSRELFERKIEGLVERSISLCEIALDCSGVANSFSDVVLVGGSTRTPLIRKRIRERLGFEPASGLNPDEAVAYGAAIYAEELARDKKDFSSYRSLLLEVAPRSLGAFTAAGATKIIIKKNTPIPAVRTERFPVDGVTKEARTIGLSQGDANSFKGTEKIGSIVLGKMDESENTVDVTFTVGVNGTIEVTADDTKSADISVAMVGISNSSGENGRARN